MRIEVHDTKIENAERRLNAKIDGHQTNRRSGVGGRNRQAVSQRDRSHGEHRPGCRK